DIDLDGDLDILIGTFQEVVWYENLGSGMFSNKVTIGTGDDLVNVKAFDAEGDGDMDVVAISHEEELITLYLNDGALGYSSSIVLATDLNNPTLLNTLDIDGDDDIDIIAGLSNGGNLVWFENTGGGVFAGMATLQEGMMNNAWDILCVDLDGDGDEDILYPDDGDGKTAWHENLDDGIISEENTITPFVSFPSNTLTADLNGDGIIDVISDSGEGEFIWFEGLGQGEFSTQTVLVEDIGYISTFQLADLNGDGNVDIVKGSNLGNSVSWFENLGGSYSTEVILDQNAEFTRSLALDDLDGDGNIDIVIGSSLNNSNEVSWIRNEGGGVFSDKVVLSTQALGVQQVIIEDLNQDGNLDILAACEDADAILFLENQGGGVFTSDQEVSTNASGPTSVQVADYDNDGDMDVIGCSGTSNVLAIYPNVNGVFSTEFIIGNGNIPTKISATDYDLDGDMDILGVSDGFGFVFYYENVGSGVYQDNLVITNPDFLHFTAFATPDLDNDGDHDILIGAFGTPVICWYENLGAPGCTDPTACNFNPNLMVDTDNCCYDLCGCADEDALNYDPEAQCENGTCLFEISGIVFADEDEDGFFDDNIEEFPLPSQEVVLQPLGWTAWTDDLGQFSFEVPSGNYSVEVINDNEFPFSTTEDPWFVNVPNDDLQNEFGVSKEEPLYGIDVDFYPTGVGYPCNDWENHNICFRNQGNVTLSGIVEIQINELFQDYQEVTPIDSVVGNTLYMSFNGLEPGQMFFYDVLLLTPDVEYIGEFITSIALVYGFHDGEQVAFGSEELTVEMTCAYDPNDKQVFPTGYEEPHFILNDTQLEYLIRFQNTGNAPATNVLVTDTIDENLDLETFALVANSHSVQATVKPDLRVIEFFFENIMLPDSTNNEPESHGLVSFFITPYPDLEPGTELNNTGNIYFDNNPPIITNTTWNTIYECTNALADVEPYGDTFCSSELFTLENTQDYVETYEWSSGIDELSSESIMESYFEPGMHIILLEVSNPLCEAANTIMIDVIDSPEITISEDMEICEGESATIAISSEDNAEWQGLGTNPEQTVSPDQTQEYIAIATNDDGCETVEGVVITVNPNPTAYAGFDASICLGDSTLLIGEGAQTLQWTGFEPGGFVTVTPEEDTTYELLATNEFGCEDTDEVVVEVNDNPSAAISVDGNNLITGPGISFQWYLDGEIIEDASNQEYYVLQDGNYSVEVTNEWGCSTLSEEQFVMYVGVDELSRWGLLSFYPNPASDRIIVESEDQMETIEIFDATGRIVISKTVNASMVSIDVSLLTEGIYHAKLRGFSGKNISKKFMIQR
ncbi:MAG: FG-GAP-like repeat-containing protein, partial [Bacteroidota bacterium]